MTTSWRPADVARQPVPERRTIPYEYAFRFELTGQKDRLHTQTVMVSVEAPFTAQSIGYGVIPRRPPLRFGPQRPDFQPVRPTRRRPLPPNARAMIDDVTVPTLLRSLGRTLATTIAGGSLRSPRGLQRGLNLADVLTRGFRISPDHLEQILLADDATEFDADFLATLFEEVAPVPEDIQFLYALFDEGTGRAFQNEPILNTAGLGTADGDRPFRYLAVPITFEVRTTIRMEITEVSEYPGDLHVSLHGYRTLGQAGTPTGRAAMRARKGRR